VETDFKEDAKKTQEMKKYKKPKVKEIVQPH
jgi:hypothetical protein